MLGALRTLLGVSLLVGGIWFSFSVPLGQRTLAEHVDRISETREAQELLDGTRSRVNPALEDAKQRVLGEYIEAPTAITTLPASGTDAALRSRSGMPKPGTPKHAPFSNAEADAKADAKADASGEPKLPRATPAGDAKSPRGGESTGAEPGLPGRRSAGR